MSLAKLILASLWFTSFAFAAAAEAGGEAMLKYNAAVAIAEYENSKDLAVLAPVFAQLRASYAGNKAFDEAAFGVAADLLNSLYRSMDPRFDANVKPVINSEVPGGRYPAGVAPQSIREPAIRAEYEKTLAKDRSYAVYFTTQSTISQAINDLASTIKASVKGDPDDVARGLVERGMQVSHERDFSRRLQAT